MLTSFHRSRHILFACCGSQEEEEERTEDGRAGTCARGRSAAVSISMACFHGLGLSLLRWVDEWSFLGSIFLGHFY